MSVEPRQVGVEAGSELEDRRNGSSRSQRAGRRLHDSREELEQRALPRPVLPDDPERVALGVATYMFITRPKIDADVKTGRAAASRTPRPLAPAQASGFSSLKFDFGGVNGGAVGTASARF